MSQKSIAEQLEAATITPFTLIIKGTPQQARDAAVANGCKVHHVARLVAKGQTLVIALADERKLAIWFTSDTQEGRSGKGWPNGSLLFYTPKDNTHRFTEMGIPR